MPQQGRVEKFLFEDKGIENIFKNLSWLTASAILFKLSIVLKSASILISLITALSSICLFSLAVIWGLKVILIPLLQTLFGKNEKYFQMSLLGWRVICEWQFWIYLILSLKYFALAMWWFDAIVELSFK